MIILTQDDLRNSKNSIIIDMIESDFVLSPTDDKKNNPIKQLMNDLNRNVLINNKKYPQKIDASDKYYATSEKKLIHYLNDALGQKHTDALSTAFSQVPLSVLPTALLWATMKEDALEEMLEASSGERKSNLYVNDDILHYEISVKDFKLANNKILPGSISFTSVYDADKKAFVFKEMKVSNHVLKDMVLENVFEGNLSLIKAGKEEFIQQLTESLKSIDEIRQNLNANHPLSTLYQQFSISKTALMIEEDNGNKTVSQIEKELHEHKKICELAIKETAKSIKFLHGKLLLNKISDIFGFEKPFKDVKQIDEIKHTFLEMRPR